MHCEAIPRPKLLLVLAALTAWLWSPALAWADQVRGAVVSLALWSDGTVFRSEANGAAQVLSALYGHGGPVVVRINTRKRLAAGPEEAVRALALAEKGMDLQRDVLFVVLTSHGSRGRHRGARGRGGRGCGRRVASTMRSRRAAFATKC